MRERARKARRCGTLGRDLATETCGVLLDSRQLSSESGSRQFGRAELVPFLGYF